MEILIHTFRGMACAEEVACCEAKEIVYET